MAEVVSQIWEIPKWTPTKTFQKQRPQNSFSHSGHHHCLTGIKESHQYIHLKWSKWTQNAPVPSTYSSHTVPVRWQLNTSTRQVDDASVVKAASSTDFNELCMALSCGIAGWSNKIWEVITWRVHQHWLMWQHNIKRNCNILWSWLLWRLTMKAEAELGTLFGYFQEWSLFLKCRKEFHGASWTRGMHGLALLWVSCPCTYRCYMHEALSAEIPLVRATCRVIISVW